MTAGPIADLSGVRGEVAIRLPFADRSSAGKILARVLSRFRADKPLILALPRGGIPVAFEIARELDADLDLLIVRKLGAPGEPEFGIGAIVDGDKPEVVINFDLVRHLGLPVGYIEQEAQRQLIEIERRRKEYMDAGSPQPVAGRTVVVVDDGIATGGTVRAALQTLRKKQPARLVLAVPVAPWDVLQSLGQECDELVCLATPEPFYAVGKHYADFSQTTDAEVKRLLTASANREPHPSP